MPVDERNAFEQKLNNDSEFKTIVEDIHTTLLGIEAQALREKLDDFHQELPKQIKTETPDPKVRFLNFRRLAVAAMTVIALGSLWYFTGSSNDRLYEQHFRPDPGLPTTMGNSDNFEFYDAMVNYKTGDYDKAISKWNVLHEKSPKNDTITYFLGAAYLANDMEDKAIPLLTDVVNSAGSAFDDDAYYYLGFAYLKKEDMAKAKDNFEKSSMENAKTILSKLKN